mmetsp:Transcript_26716/g.60408  ORF Transcript_26716/g.60408 Transcript_26716/m.60408 type:complete len:267 (-) Transcript_26716:270-1070(-)
MHSPLSAAELVDGAQRSWESSGPPRTSNEKAISISLEVFTSVSVSGHVHSGEAANECSMDLGQSIARQSIDGSRTGRSAARTVRAEGRAAAAAAFSRSAFFACRFGLSAGAGARMGGWGWTSISCRWPFSEPSSSVQCTISAKLSSRRRRGGSAALLLAPGRRAKAESATSSATIFGALSRSRKGRKGASRESTTPCPEKLSSKWAIGRATPPPLSAESPFESLVPPGPPLPPAASLAAAWAAWAAWARCSATFAGWAASCFVRRK